MADAKKPLIRGAVQDEKRLLWRNETPLVFNDEPAAHGGHRPGLIQIALQNFNSMTSNRTDAAAADETLDGAVADIADGSTEAPTHAPTAFVSEQATSGTSAEGDNSTTTGAESPAAALIEAMLGDRTNQTTNSDNPNATTATATEEFFEEVNTPDAATEPPVEEDDSTDAPTASPTDNIKQLTQDIEAQLNAGPSHNENGKQDCFWRVLTGTGCTADENGDIVNGHQHQYLVADGECRYNDFLGYYRAGCRPKMQLNPWDEEIPSKIILHEVFCTDPTCSVGCQEEGVVHANSVHTSNSCTISSFYDEDGEIAKENRKKKDKEFEFSYEFIGGCLETEECEIVECEDCTDRKCKDDKKYEMFDKKWRDCEWVAFKPDARCELDEENAYDACRASCHPECQNCC